MTNQSIRDTSSCCICAEIDSRIMPESFRRQCGLATRVVSETSDFVVLPSVSPLAEGHVMLLPKRHVSSMAQLSPGEKDQMCYLLDDVVRRTGEVWGDTILLEHGVGRGKEGGCGITHAHVHVIPFSEACWAPLAVALELSIGTLAPAQPLRNALASLDAADGYLLVGRSADSVSCFVSNQLPSQFMRRMLAEILFLPTWDWREMSNWQWVRDTYEKLTFAA